MWPPGAQAHQGEHRDLEEARNRIAAVARELKAAASAASDAAADAAAARRRLAQVETAINMAGAALDEQQMMVDQARERLEALQHQAAETRSRLAERAASLYKQGPAAGLSAILASDDIQDAMDRSAFIGIVTRVEEAALEQMAAARVAVSAQRQRFEQHRAHLEALKVEQERLRAEVAHVLDHRLMVLAEVHGRVDELRHRKEDLEEDARRLTNLIRVRQQRASSIGPPSISGYVWPVCGRVTSGFGRRWGRLHSGVDIDGSTGQPIVAAKGGTVIFAGWRGGYGRLVLIDHGDGAATAYAHQSAIAVGQGQRVARGERIGSVGSSGNSTGSHLHFETRVNGGPVDPLRFLPQGC